jgi:uncharacterized protein YceH (UPF0502 family)
MSDPSAVPPSRPTPTGARAILLSAVEARVLGVLVEKAHTVPDTYPLSLNALVAGCNQRNNRDPVMTLGDAQVQAAIDALKSSSLVIESSGARVTRYAHNTGRVLQVPDQAVALLAVLMLRGPQTAAELRIGTERLHRFADVSSVEGFLDELAARAAERGGALVLRLARRPGEREARWVHLLSGPPAEGAAAAAADASDEPPYPDASAAELEALREGQQRLGAELADLRRLVERIARELRLDDDT